jgi:phosphoglycolate phosphatase
MNNILFDLDGTLTDSVHGIMNCFRYTLENLNLSLPTETELLSFVGPPLHRTFAALLQTSDAASVEKAVAVYRRRFDEVCWLENAVYADVPQMLESLKTDGYNLFVATSKDENAALKILNYFQLNTYFVEIAGSDPDGRLADKTLLISELLERHELIAEETVMVGDRMHDILAAKQNGVLALGITYGYGSLTELREAGADFICDKPMQIRDLIKEFAPAKKLTV